MIMLIVKFIAEKIDLGLALSLLLVEVESEENSMWSNEKSESFFRPGSWTWEQTLPFSSHSGERGTPHVQMWNGEAPEKVFFFYWQSIQCIKACKLQIPKKNLKIILQNIPWRLLRSLTECHGTKDSRWVLGRIRLLLDQYIQYVDSRCVFEMCLNRSLKLKLSLTSIFNIWIQDVF